MTTAYEKYKRRKQELAGGSSPSEETPFDRYKQARAARLQAAAPPPEPTTYPDMANFQMAEQKIAKQSDPVISPTDDDHQFRQRAIDDPNTNFLLRSWLKLIDPIVSNPTYDAFSTRSGVAAMNAMGGIPQTAPSTGNAFADAGADALGMIGGFMAGGGSGSAMGAGGAGAAMGAEKIAGGLLPKLATSRIGGRLATGAAGGAAYEGTLGMVNDESPGQIAKNMGTGALTFGALKGAGAFGRLPSALAGSAVFGGQSYLNGGTPSEIAANALFGGGMGVLGGEARRKARTGPTFTGDVLPALESGNRVRGLLPEPKPIDFYTGKHGTARSMGEYDSSPIDVPYYNEFDYPGLNAGPVKLGLPTGKIRPKELPAPVYQTDYYAGDAGLSKNIDQAGRKLLPGGDTPPLLPDRFVKGSPDYYASASGVVSRNPEIVGLYEQIKPSVSQAVEKTYVPGIKPAPEFIGKIIDQTAKVTPEQKAELVNLFTSQEVANPGPLPKTKLGNIGVADYKGTLKGYKDLRSARNEMQTELDRATEEEAAFQYEMQKELGANDLWKRIRDNGGIKPYKNGYLAEEYKGLNSYVKNKDGLTMDEMADTLGYSSEADFLRDLQQQEVAQKQTMANIRKNVDLYKDPRYKGMIETIPEFDKQLKDMESNINPADISKLDQMEVAARERIAKSKGQLNANPVGVWADYAIVGAAKIARGLKDFKAWSAEMVKDFGDGIKAYLDGIWRRSNEIHRNPPKPKGKLDFTKLKDISGFKSYSSDIYRIFEDVFGEHYDSVRRQVLDPFDVAKGKNIDMQHGWLNKMKSQVVDKLGIKAGSKESALVQKYGEKQITLQELQKRSPDKWRQIVEADKWFRTAYDTLIDQVNAVRKLIYPNNPEKIVPKRKDYYRHFREFSDITGLKNIFETPSAIDPNLVGVSEFTQPRAKWASFMQKRGLGPFKNDAVGGFLDYIPAASYSINIDPHLGRFMGLSKQIAKATEKSKNLNNFINFLHKYSQDLAGKTNAGDRFIQEVIPGGRATFKGINWLNNRIKGNVVLGNASSALAQTANIPQGIAFAKQHSFKGAGRSLKDISRPSPEISKSIFMKERYGGYGSKVYRQFNEAWLGQPKKAAQWMMETADRIGTTFIWESAYSKGVAEKVADPIKYADAHTRKLVAGRGVGEVPLLQKSKMFQIIAPFTLEVGNLWHVQKDFVKAKDLGGLMALYVGNFLFNKAMEQIKGSGVAFDPIGAMLDAFEEDTTAWQKVGRLAGEIGSNMPAGQVIASTLVPADQRRQWFGREDPTRFGSGLLGVVESGVRDPLYKLLPPFGGGQLKKAVEGYKGLEKGIVYGKDGTKAKYPVANTPINTAKGLLFGPGGFNEALPYYKQDRRPMSESQTKAMEYATSQGRGERYYNSVQKVREIDAILAQMRSTWKDTKLSQAEKERRMAELTAKLKKAQQK